MAYYRKFKKGPRKVKKKPQYQGRTFASAAEIKCAKDMQERGILWEYEPMKLKWTPPDKNYAVDFGVTRADGSVIYIEYKGYLRSEDKVKMIVIKRQHPSIDIRIVFTHPEKPVEGATKRKDGSKLSNAEWATKNGYLYAEKVIPDEWLKVGG